MRALFGAFAFTVISAVVADQVSVVLMFVRVMLAQCDYLRTRD